MIDLYSDTVTKPTPGMYAAMTSAALGDDQRGDDPTARAFEERAADVLGQPAALLLPTATMANQVAIRVGCTPASEVLCHETAHVFNFEGAGIAANSGAQVLTLAGERGAFSAETLRGALRPRDPHFPASALVVVENTSNLGGGAVWPDEQFDAVAEVCKRRQLWLHLDGARLFNAAVARGVAVKRWSSVVDSVQVCFSKGLGCAFGAVLAGSDETIERARRVRQRMGGALRQAGVMAAAMDYALDYHVERLSEDHRRLLDLARALSAVSALELSVPETNILYFRHDRVAAGDFAARLRERGVWVSQVGERLRICTHLGIDDAAIRVAGRVIAELACQAS